jgi:hypothetical protein
VLDFGIAKILADGAEPLTTQNLGTPIYMSPEQIRGDGDIGPAADLYTLGHVAYALLVGAPYWAEERAWNSRVLYDKIEAGAREPATHRARRRGATLPETFDAWFARATAVDPLDRFATATALIEALGRALGVARPPLESLGGATSTRVITPATGLKPLPATAAPAAIEAWERAFDPGPVPWSEVEAACRESRRATTTPDDLYVRREIEKEFEPFLESDKTMLVLVGASGMGKTTLLRQVLRRYAAQGDLCYYVSSSSLHGELGMVEAGIVFGLTGGASDDAKTVFASLERMCKRRGRVLLIAVDAVNEYNAGDVSHAAGPHDFLGRLDEMAASLKRIGYGRVKYVITMRPETWKRGRTYDRLRHGRSLGAYWVSGHEIGQPLGRYTDPEAREAYAKYAGAYRLEGSLDDLPEATRYDLRDPLLLKLAAEVHAGEVLPVDLEAGELFRHYEDRLASKWDQSRTVLREIVAAMFEGESAVIRSDTIVRGDLYRTRPHLWRDLDPSDPTTTGAKLRDENVLRYPDERGRDQAALHHPDERIRFTYDRFTEYLLSGELVARVRAEAKRSRAPVLQVAFTVMRANLESPARLGTVARVLRHALRLFQFEDGFPDLLLRLARSDERGFALVTATMGSIAKRAAFPGRKSGVETLAQLLASLQGDVDRASVWRALGGGRARFPIIDAIHRLLVDEDYQRWRRGQTREEHDRHLDVLHDSLVWGMLHRDATVHAAAIQYLFFLWKQADTRPHAERITSLLVDRIKPISLWTLVSEQRRLLGNLFGLFLLTLSGIDDQGVPMALGHARAAFAAALTRVRLDEEPPTTAISRLAENLEGFLRGTLERLPNPVNLRAFQQVFERPGVKEQARRVHELVRQRAGGEIDVRELERLSLSTNGWVLTMLSFALSVRYEWSTPAQRLALVETMTSLFFAASAAPQTEYVVSLAMYHINYFGAVATRDTIERMGRMTEHILRVRKGKFSLEGVERDYNAIGTYGRVLQKFTDASNPREIATEPVLDYAIRALDGAALRGDDAYYLYVCEGIGLLGVLTEPQHVFDVMAHVLGPVTPPGAPLARRTPRDVAARERLVQSLANIRVLYRAEVDHWLLDLRDDQSLYADVAQRVGKFDLPLLYSWTSEELTFRFFTAYYEQAGDAIIDGLQGMLDQGSPYAALRHMFALLLKLHASLSSPHA